MRCIVLVAACGLTGSAIAGPVASFTYSDLLGSYDTGTNVYRAVAGGDTAGDVTRLISPGGSAEFDTGFFNGLTQADYSLELNVGSIMAGSASGMGTLVITDDNGDTLTADVVGSFRVFGGAVSYEGQLANVSFNDNSGDMTFDGSTSGSFSSVFPMSPLDGSILNLFFNPGNFFGTGFSNQVTLSSGLIVPAPGSLAVLGAAGLVARRRRR